MLIVCSVNSISFSFIRLLGSALKRVEISYVDKLDARKLFDFNLLRISPEL